MTSELFIQKAHDMIKSISKYSDHSIHLVWFSKTLQNWKGIFIQIVPDAVMYEVTYNGDKKEIYCDKYSKIVHIKEEVNDEAY